MDGVSDVKDIVKRAMKWGHKAIAITDHGDVQAFPDANHTVPSDSDFKVIYGVEAYLVDDLKGMVTDSQNQDLDADYVVFDLETTGFSPETNRIMGNHNTSLAEFHKFRKNVCNDRCINHHGIIDRRQLLNPKRNRHLWIDKR